MVPRSLHIAWYKYEAKWFYVKEDGSTSIRLKWGKLTRLPIKRSSITKNNPFPGLDSLVGLWGALSVLAYSALDEVSLLSGLRGKDRELPLLCKRLADPHSRRECRLSRRPGIDRHLANRTLSLGLPGNFHASFKSRSKDRLRIADGISFSLANFLSSRWYNLFNG